MLVKKLSLCAVFLSLALTSMSCASAGLAPSSEAQSAATSDIAEAVFRYQFRHNASSLQEKADRYCLSLPGEQSPDTAFLQRFERNTPPVVGVDECRRKSGKNLLFRIQKLDWRSDDEVWVSGGYWEGNLSSSGESYRVRRKDGKWVVDGARMETIS